MRTAKNRKVRRHTKKLRKNNLHHRYLMLPFRGGGNFWHKHCEPEPKLTPEMMRTEEFVEEFRTVRDDNYVFMLGDSLQGANNRVHSGICNTGQYTDHHSTIYAFRESIYPLSSDPENRNKQMLESFNEVRLSVELAQKGLSPNIYMAGIYKKNQPNNLNPLKHNHTFQVMEFITPFKHVIAKINTSRKSREDKSELIRQLFNRTRDLYKEVARQSEYLFLDLKPGNLGLRGDVLFADSQVLILDADLFFNMAESDFNKLLDKVNTDGLATNLYGAENYRKEAKAQFMVFIFASNTYMIWNRAGYFSNELSQYPFAAQMLIDMLGTPEERILMSRLQTIVYKRVGRYRDMFATYILKTREDGAIAGSIGIIPRFQSTGTYR